MKYLLIILLLCGCESVQEKSVSRGEEAVYTPIDPESVEEAKALLDENRAARMQAVSKGKVRSHDYKPLLLNLVAFHDHGYELKLSDIAPYVDELPEIASIFTTVEAEEFVKYATQDDLSIETLYKEASKGNENNEAAKAKDDKIAQLQDQLDKKYVEEITSIATKFLWAGGILLGLSIFSSVPAIAPIASKAQATGYILLGVGGLIMLLGHFLDLAREFFNHYGEKLLLLLLIPLILLFIGKKTHEVVEEIRDEEEDDGDETEH